ncbi:ABC transporter substrate-binding protein [Peribacillus sp. NPDC097225]|uniref:ABC transporter substrate-binding protein n=1 Tax=Peribacillus sp. NPDC097225 TaxID=3364400 RepID=UPI00381B161C
MKKKSLLVAVLMAFVLMLTACNKDDASGGVKTGDASGKDQYKIVVIAKSNNSEFWQTVNAGAEEAAKEENVNVTFQARPDETDIAGQVSIVEDAINQGVDAIVLAPSDVDALIAVVDKADAAGIPVITIDSKLNSDTPKSHVATDNEAAAVLAAENLAKAIGEEGKVAIVSFVAGASTAVAREQGFISKIKEYPNIEIINTFYSDADRNKAMTITQDILTSTPDIKGIFGTNEPSAVGVSLAVEQTGFQDKVTVVGFDSSEDEIYAINNGSMVGTVVQNPFNMGYSGVKQAVKVIKGEEVEKVIDTGVTYVNKENLESEEVQKLLNPLGK